MAFKDISKSSVNFPQEKRQKILLGILGLVVIVSLVVIYFGFWRESDTPSEELVSPEAELVDDFDEPNDHLANSFSEQVSSDQTGQASYEQIKESITFDTGFLKDPNFKELKTYGQWPIQIGEKGRDNPFSVY